MTIDGRRLYSNLCIFVDCDKPLWCDSRCADHCKGGCGKVDECKNRDHDGSCLGGPNCGIEERGT